MRVKRTQRGCTRPANQFERHDTYSSADDETTDLSWLQVVTCRVYFTVSSFQLSNCDVEPVSNVNADIANTLHSTTFPTRGVARLIHSANLPHERTALKSVTGCFRASRVWRITFCQGRRRRQIHNPRYPFRTLFYSAHLVSATFLHINPAPPAAPRHFPLLAPTSIRASTSSSGAAKVPRRAEIGQSRAERAPLAQAIQKSVWPLAMPDTKLHQRQNHPS